MNTTLYRDQRKRKRDWEKDVVRNASRILLLCVLLPMKLRLSLYTHNTFRNCYLYNENFCYCIAITIGQSSVSSRILTRSQLSIHSDVWWVIHSPLWLLFRWTMLILYTHFFSPGYSLTDTVQRLICYQTPRKYLSYIQKKTLFFGTTLSNFLTIVVPVVMKYRSSWKSSIKRM